MAGAISQQPTPSGVRVFGAHARIPSGRHEPPRSTNPPKGVLQRLREAHRWTGAGHHYAYTEIGQRLDAYEPRRFFSVVRNGVTYR